MSKNANSTNSTNSANDNLGSLFILGILCIVLLFGFTYSDEIYAIIMEDDNECTLPVNTAYDFTAASGSMDMDSFNVKGITCTDPSQTPGRAIACTTAGEPYTVSGCSNPVVTDECIQPVNPAFNFSNLSTNVLTRTGFDVQGITCSAGYSGLPTQPTACTTGGEPYTVSGCPASPGTACTQPVNPAYNFTAASGSMEMGIFDVQGITCTAANYGTANAPTTCTIAGGPYNVSGCTVPAVTYCTSVDTSSGCTPAPCVSTAADPYPGCTPAPCTDINTPYPGCTPAPCTSADTSSGCTPAPCTGIDAPYQGCTPNTDSDCSSFFTFYPDPASYTLYLKDRYVEGCSVTNDFTEYATGREYAIILVGEIDVTVSPVSGELVSFKGSDDFIDNTVVQVTPTVTSDNGYTGFAFPSDGVLDTIGTYVLKLTVGSSYIFLRYIRIV